MYQRLLKIFIVTTDPQLMSFLGEVPPQDKFSHRFVSSSDPDKDHLQDCSLLILDMDCTEIEDIKQLHPSEIESRVLVGCFSDNTLCKLAQTAHLFDQIWMKPFEKEFVHKSFIKILKQFKAREDAALTRKYLDTLIDSLPDLIWFKDARGSHLKVNNSFCKAVNKTKSQIENRGHYYIWDLEPDEYAAGEYICLESEEIVLNKKETCLFDETVKCGDEMRKFKTYKSPIFDHDGDVLGTVGIARDVTDLQNLVIELNILIESLPFAVMVTDKDRVITSVNQKFIDIFLLDRSGLIGKNLDSLLDSTGNFTKSKRWLIDRETENTLLLSKKQVLKLHDEKLLDIFGVLAGHIYLFIDITLEHQQKNKLLIDANTDHLTKLNNRRSLQDFMRKTSCHPGMVLMLADLDHFKEVNDRFGHDEGDRVLVAFSNLLQDVFALENLYRLGGDEFAILLPSVDGPEEPKHYAEQLLEGFEEKVAGRFVKTNISVSIGIAMDVSQEENFGELFKKADLALYESKKYEKNTYTFWSNLR